MQAWPAELENWVSRGIRAQLRQTLENIKSILGEAGTSLEDVIKVNAYLADIGEFEEYDEVYRGYFDHEHPPARTTVELGSFPGDMALEIDVVAHVPHG